MVCLTMKGLQGPDVELNLDIGPRSVHFLSSLTGIKAVCYDFLPAWLSTHITTRHSKIS
jgi:hypothetical protein